MRNRKYIFRFGIITLFLLALYLVEIGPWGSSNVAQYSNGYGTFDMKEYNPEIVYSTLADIREGGIHAMKMYYVMDYIFIAVMLSFQIMISKAVFTGKVSILGQLANIAALIRGAADLGENILLSCVISKFPIQDITLVNIASVFTRIKLRMIVIWSLLLIVGIAIKMVSSLWRLIKEKRYS